MSVAVGPGAFRFRAHPGAPFIVTTVYDGAKVKGKTTKEVLNAKGQITVRLQGIDAPELHYMPQALLKVKDQSKKQRELFLKWNDELRQRLGETAANALGTRLAALGQDPLGRVAGVFARALRATVGDSPIAIGGRVPSGY